MSTSIGVVVPAYNAGRWLPMTLASLQVQQDVTWRCVIVDDGSTDDTLAMARASALADQRITVVAQENGGVSRARNAGLDALDGEATFVLFLDSDDVLLPGSLAELEGALERRPEAVGAYGLAELIDESGRRVLAGSHPARQRRRNEFVPGRGLGQLRGLPPTADVTRAELMLANPVWPPAAALLRAASVREVGGFDESYAVQEDWELWLRMAANGPFVALDKVLAEYRRHGGNLTGDTMTNIVTQARLRARAFEAASPAEAATFAAAWRRMQVSRVHHTSRLAVRAARAKRLPDLLRAVATMAFVVCQLLRGVPVRPGLLYNRTLAWEKGLDQRLLGRSAA